MQGVASKLQYQLVMRQELLEGVLTQTQKKKMSRMSSTRPIGTMKSACIVALCVTAVQGIKIKDALAWRCALARAPLSHLAPRSSAVSTSTHIVDDETNKPDDLSDFLESFLWDRHDDTPAPADAPELPRLAIIDLSEMRPIAQGWRRDFKRDFSSLGSHCFLSELP